MPRLEPAKSPRNKMRCRIIMSRIDFEQFVRDFSKRIMVDAFGVSVGGGQAAGKSESSGPYDRDPTPRLRALAILHSSRLVTSRRGIPLLAKWWTFPQRKNFSC